MKKSRFKINDLSNSFLDVFHINDRFHYEKSVIIHSFANSKEMV